MPNEKQQAGIVTIGLLLGLFLSSLDQTIVSTAMPTVVKELGGFTLYSWVFAVYMLASTAVMPIYGKLADLFGRKKVYVTGLSLFLVGSVLCGLAGNMTELIVYRGIQGLGAGALMPVSMTIVADVYPPQKRGKFMGLFSTVFAVSSIFGPALGGIIADQWSWGWIFYLNVPIGIAVLVLVTIGLQESRNSERRSIDGFGAVALSAAIISILLALVLGGDGEGGGTGYAWTSSRIVGLFGIGGVLLALFVWIETRAKEPIVPLRLFRIRAIACGHIVGFFMSAGLFGAIVYIPLFVQGVIGVNASLAGYILTPLMLSVIVTSMIGGRLMSKVSYRAILVPSMALMTIGFILFQLLSVHTTSFQMVLYMIVAGLGMGAVYPTVGTAAQSAVESSVRGAATSSSQFFRSIGGTIGISVFGTVMSRQMASGLTEIGSKQDIVPSDLLPRLADPQLLLDSDARASLPPEALEALRAVFSHALSDVFLGGLIFVGIGLLASFFMGNARLVEKSQRPESVGSKSAV